MQSQRTCSKPGCGDPHHAGGWCGKHYQRMRKRGTVERPPKRCPTCGSDGPFGKRSYSKDGQQSLCKPCRNAGRRKWYQTPEGKAYAFAWAKEQQRRRYALIVKIKLEAGCADCGYREHPAALQYDHVRGEKLFDIAHGRKGGKSVLAILAEIEKCEVVCANCHSIRTYKRSQVRKAGVTAHEEMEAPAKLW